MRLLKRAIDDATGAGSATLIPQDPEDMWHLYNLIRAKDILRAPAIRKVKHDTSTDATYRTTERTILTVRVLRIDFDPQSSELHISGRVCEENKWVAIGQHHTIDLELNRQFTLTKVGEDGEGWDSVALSMLKEATDVRKRAATWAVVLQEGLANICVITDYETLIRQKVELAIPRKGHGSDAHDRALQKFFQMTAETLWRHFDVKSLDPDAGKQPPLLLASPGFTADGLRKFIVDQATAAGDKALMAYARRNIVVAHSSSGHKHALDEVLRQPPVLARLSDTKFAKQAKEVDRFFELLRLDDGRAWYGPGEVEKAVDKGAVGQGGGILLLSNKLFRSQKIKERQRWVALHDRVLKVEGGRVIVLSSAHESGKRLEGLGGVGAILTFPLEDLDEGEEDRSDHGSDVSEDDGKDAFGDGPLPNGHEHGREPDFEI